MSRRRQVQELLRNSEARTGNRVRFIVSFPDKDGRILVTVHDSELKVELPDSLTSDSSRKILEWFEPLAKAHRIPYS